MNYMLKTLLQVNLVVSLCTLSEGMRCRHTGATVEYKLRQHLFKQYTPSARPMMDQRQILNVTFNMRLIRLVGVEEKSQKVTSQAYFSMKWKNDFLKWDPYEFGDLEYLAVRPNEVWIPDIILKNNADSDSIQIQRDTDTVWLKYDGKNSWYPRVTLVSSFKADVSDFPFDNQQFFFHFGSWNHGEKQLRIVKNDKPMIDAHYLQDAEWELIDKKKEIVRSRYDSDAYIEIIFNYVVSRRPAYSVITAIAPSLGLMTLTLFSYILPPHNGERIKVILTSLLAFTVFLVEMNGYLPRNSESVPVIQMYYMTTMGETMVCFVVTCLFVRLLGSAAKDKNDNLPVYLPMWVKKYVLGIKECTKARSSHISKYEKISLKDSPSAIPLSLPVAMASTLPTSFKGTGNRGLGLSFSSVSGSAEKETGKEMGWKDLLEYADKLCMRVFIVIFVTTTTVILLPPFYRKYYS